MRAIRSVGAVLILAGALSMLGGCGQSGPALYPVSGKVQCDGKPVADAMVFFHRAGKSDIGESVPYGTTGPDGSYQLGTDVPGDGAVAGDYVITVVWPDMTKKENGNGERPDLLKGTYLKPTESKLKATVTTGKNDIPVIEVKLPNRAIVDPATFSQDKKDKPKK
jgi:predicted small lipoprotein YifL